jgi:two-component system, LytTR family, sensor kinase
MILGFWLLFGTFSGFLTYYQSSSYPKHYSLEKALYLELSFALISAAFGPLILLLAHRFRIERRIWVRNLAIHIAAAFLISIVEKLLWDVLALPPDSYLHKTFTYAKLLKSASGSLDTGLIVYFLILLLDYAIDYHQRYQTGLIEAAQLQTQLVQAQLQALKMQLHPHFLFNTLHTISALVQEDPEGAERMIARLSDLLRLSLESTGLQEVPLRQELEFLHLYLEIERTRFEDRLAVRFEIEDEVMDARVPSLVLQPIVENAIRHGLLNRTSDGQISIHAARQGNNLSLMVKDNGCGLPPDAMYRRSGLGLATTRGRLERLYGNNQSLILRNVKSGGVEARIQIPFFMEPALTGVRGNYGPN